MRPSTTITRKFLRHVARWREALNSNKLKLELCYLEKQFRNHSYRKLDFFFQKDFFMTGKQFTKTLLENSWLKASKTEANSIISLETDFVTNNWFAFEKTHARAEHSVRKGQNFRTVFFPNRKIRTCLTHSLRQQLDIQASHTGIISNCSEYGAL